jgi:hypothetical protein
LPVGSDPELPELAGVCGGTVQLHGSGRNPR